MKQGIGSRIQRKEDVRHLYGRSNFVTDMMLPGQSDVAFVRSPVAHARILSITKPPDFEASVYVRDDLTDVGAMVTPNTVPGYKLSAWHPLAHKKVRYVGEAIAMCVAPSRAASRVRSIGEACKTRILWSALSFDHSSTLSTSVCRMVGSSASPS